MDLIIIGLCLLFGMKTTTLAGVIITIGLLKMFIKIDDITW